MRGIWGVKAGKREVNTSKPIQHAARSADIFKLNPKPQILILLSFIAMRIIYSQYSYIVLTRLS